MSAAPPPAADRRAAARTAGTGTGTDTLDAQTLADQVTALHRTLPSIILGNTLVPAVVALLLHGTARPVLLAGWFALQMLHSGFNALAWWQTRHRPAQPRNAARRARRAILSSALSGLLWGASLPLLWPPSLELQVLLVFLIGGMTAAALHALSVLLPAYLVFLLPCVVSVVGMALWAGTTAHQVIALTVGVYGLTSARFSASLNRTLRESLQRRHEVAALAGRLRAEKERAEAASLDKSRFLAAASHDLRQPVHALSLFLSALRQQPLTPEAARLAGHAAGAVQTMGELFNALLDMSRLDAGMVQPQRRPVALRPLLQRVVEQERPAALAKGLQLRLRLPRAGAAVVVDTDPVLLERVLRNLLSNAVRYTDRGHVLLALRGARAGWLLQVRDSGIGIPAERQADVFREFVQLHNPERDRNKGLGLGLAIVKRMVELLGLRLALRSAPGCGSCFTLRLPHATAGAAPAAGAPAATTDGLLPPGLRVVVIDDDDEILAATAALLSGWRCEVLAAADVPQLRPALLQHRGRPDLLISDFRLRGERSGLDAIAELRDEYNEDIPAILVTGDTAPQRLIEARASGLLLLHKPVAADELRAAIVRALAAPGPGHP